MCMLIPSSAVHVYTDSAQGEQNMGLNSLQVQGIGERMAAINICRDDKCASFSILKSN